MIEKKEKYKQPIIMLASIQIEECIVAQSALTKPVSSNDVKQEWETDTDVTQSFTWD